MSELNKNIDLSQSDTSNTAGNTGSSSNPSVVRAALDASDKIEEQQEKVKASIKENMDDTSERFEREAKTSDSENQKSFEKSPSKSDNNEESFSKEKNKGEDSFIKNNNSDKKTDVNLDDDKPFERKKSKDSFIKGEDSNVVEKGAGKAIDTAIQAETGGVVGGREDVARIAEKAKKKVKKEAVKSGAGALGRFWILSKILSALKAFLAMFVQALAVIAQALFGWIAAALAFLKGILFGVANLFIGLFSGIGSAIGSAIAGVASFLGISTIAATVTFLGTCVAVVTMVVGAVVGSVNDQAATKDANMVASPSCAEQAYNAVFEALEGDDGTFSNQEIDNAKKITSVFWEWSYKSLGEEKATIMISGILGNLYTEGHIDFAGVEGVYDEPTVPGEKKSKIMSSRDSMDAWVTGTLIPVMYSGKSLSEDTYYASTAKGGDDRWYCHIGVWSATGIHAYDYWNWCDANDQVWYSADANLAWFIVENETNRAPKGTSFKDWCIKGEPDCHIREVNFSDADAYKDATKVFFSRWEYEAGPKVESWCDSERWEWAEKWVPYVNMWLQDGDIDSAYAASIIGLANSSADNASNDAVSDMMGDCSGFHAKYNNASIAAAALSMSYFKGYETEIMDGNPDYDVESGGTGFTQSEIDQMHYPQSTYDSKAHENRLGNTKTYEDVISAIEDVDTTPNTKGIWSSCDRGVATSLKWSGAYDNCLWGAPGNQLTDFELNPEQFDCFAWDGDPASLEIGDVLQGEGHIVIYVGTGVQGGLVESKWHDRADPNTHYICHASRFDRGIMCGVLYMAGSHSWTVARCKKYEDNPKFTHILDEQGAQEEVSEDDTDTN